jgi:hypothetical protein
MSFHRRRRTRERKLALAHNPKPETRNAPTDPRYIVVGKLGYKIMA